ncbi:UbiH/UbiF/VisC/COQ6 family ubiquinone biosynthesis hydroxylase [Roseivivax sp. GX 12232]|uniref:UbiH/UbiF/VisC/COQ6 family ubiquinone biosynthesis hydroxylase n=1 Tax=Roseivivax sp. GX 12232 TaxID=2900547 RepID=UPI001E534593|nr:UbiH/UbiF/VisC/COQ6 family ubiquinone biosynthesis hydroxylase [Roseivivax sp. GX 12232]MCE0506038.1 UbiH/UbiF/VisC/COQ6 family ubiquinone biosynthesis hydroxylase [Roseivivax sp. GX 12232]
MTPDCDIAIIGGGLAGGTLALALAEAGFSVCLLDAAPEATHRAADFDGRSYALAQASKRLLANLGLWSGLAESAQPMREIKVTDGRVGEARVALGLHFEGAELEEGPMGFMVEDRHLRRVLLDRLADHPGITHRRGTRVTGQRAEPAAQVLELEGGETLTARLAVGADGRTSGTASRAGISRTGWDYPQTALVCAIAHERPHQGVAHQLFLPSGPLAILPLTGNRSSIVWSERRGLAERINALPEADYLTVLRPRFGDFLGAVSLAGARFTYPLGLSLAQALTAPRLALVGDAAHGVHPLAGQGLNAGLRDVGALAHVLEEARARGEDPGAAPVLDRYARWRRFDNASLGLATDLFNRLFSNDSAGLRALRDLGMRAVNATPGLRRAAMREAAGLTGELPRLMAREGR